MDIAFVESLIGLVEKSRLSELELSTGGKRLRLSRTVSRPVDMGSSPPPATSLATEIALPAAVVRSEPIANPAEAPTHRVMAGLGGTFFTRPAPGEATFVEVGDVVQEGQVLAIIEAMKMLNSVEADVSGVIARVCVEDGAAIAAGADIFLIEPR